MVPKLMRVSLPDFLLNRLFAFILFLVICIIAGQTASAQKPLFNLLNAKQTSVTFSNDIAETESLNVLSYEYFYNGAGVAVGDINNDGLPDLFFTGNMKPNKLYLNLGGLKFKDITRQASPALEGRANSWKTGVTMADVNGDGLLDIYICYSGKTDEATRRNQLFINKGNNKFEEQAAAYGIDDPGYSTQAAFLDYDGDGDLDMFLLNHNIKKIDNMELARYKSETDKMASNKLYRNDKGHFTDVSADAGIIQNPLTFGLGIAIADINLDGWPDIYVTNDYNEPDYIYINTHNGKFAERSKEMLRHMSHFSMGVDIADYNNDGLPDILTLDMLPADNHRQKSLQLQENYEAFALMQNQGLYNQYMRNMLQLNNGDGTFSEIGQLAGISNTDWSWCPLIADFDNDGYKDLFISNGYLRDYTNKDFLRYWGDYKIKKAMAREPFLLMDLVTAMPSTAVPDYIFKNNHDLTFTNVQKEWGFDQQNISSGAVYADLDNDGDLDLVVNNINQPASIYENTASENGADYLSLKLIGKGENTHAVGAKVYLYTPAGMQYQEAIPSRGYLSCVSGPLTFGLGKQTKVDSVKVIWPDRSVQIETNTGINKQLVINYKTTKETDGNKPKPKTFYTIAKPLFTDSVTNTTVNDFKRQLLMTFMYSKTSPVIAALDVNGDKLEDLYINDGKGIGSIYLQQSNGSYKLVELIRGSAENVGSVAAASFLDANGDGKPDLYLAKGGYANYEPNSAEMQDELYLNEGNGRFVLSPTALPVVNASSKSCIAPYDFDGDGDIDVFVGGRVVPGQYPVAPQSYLLVNDGKGKFTLAEAPFTKAGMVTDAQWIDLNNDKRKDLVLCGEMMPITIYLNTSSGFKEATAQYFDRPQSGFWFKLNVTDLNGDGQPDLVAGNLGNNSQIHASKDQPAELYYSDFDNNGSIDPFLTFYLDDKSYPFVSRDEINEQIYPMRRRFNSYKAYADATINEIFTPEELSRAQKLTANTTQTAIFLNKGGRFVEATLPVQAQFGPVTNIITTDADHDGKPDLLLFGNRSDNRLKLGAMDANYGVLLTGDGKGGFSYVDQSKSGLSVKGDVKSALRIINQHTSYLLLGTSEGALQFYKQ